MNLRKLVSLGALGLCVVSAVAAQSPALRPRDEVPQIVLPPVDTARALAEDEANFSKDVPQRFALPIAVDVRPENDGLWESVGTDMVWRLRVMSKGALSLNLGFGRYRMPAGGELRLSSFDGKYVIRPFTSDDNQPQGELWTPVLHADEVMLQVTVPAAERDQLELALAFVNHDYRGFGRPDMIKSGACNVDVICPQGDPWRDQIRSVAVISTGGSTFCTGFLVNNTSLDHKPYFMTANHCGINSGNAASLVAYWNYENSVCRPVGSPQSGQPGDGQLTQFSTGATFRSNSSPSDFTLVEFNAQIAAAFNVFYAGWDRTTGDFAGAEAIHHPNTDEKRITFSTTATTTTSYNNPSVPGDGTHVHAVWSLGVTEPGSSGSPLFSPQGRVIGQLHGGPSACGAGDLSDYYGRFSVSWAGGGTATTRLSNWLDPGATGVLTLDGANQCVAPTAPSALSATPNGSNSIQLNWTAGSGQTAYEVFRALGTCPQSTYQLLGLVVGGNTFYDDNVVSGGSTYAYLVRGIDEPAQCESTASNCDDAVATGLCTLAPAFAGAASATSAGTGACGVNVSWSAATTTCTGPLRYNVYRSTSPSFTPGAANRIATCASGTSYADADVFYGTNYYYVVRAEDNSGIGGGPCQGGTEDGNTVRRLGSPAGVAVVTSDNVEGSTANWTTAGGTGSNLWSVATSDSHSPTHSWFVADPATVSDQRLATVTPRALTQGSQLTFWHHYNTESGTSPYDGGVLEYSTDNGANWFDILAGNGGGVPANAARFLQGGYVGVISSGFSNPLAGRQAWSGDSGTWQQVRVDLTDLAGQSARFRWRFGTDTSVADVGWWVDDVAFSVPGPCGGSCPTVVKGDFNADGKVDLVFRNAVSNRHMVWTMDGITRTAGLWVSPDPSAGAWQAVATDDFDSATAPGAGPDGKSDLVYYNTATGDVQFWLMNGVNRPGAPVALSGAAVLPLNWKLSATGDFNADGRPDIVWRNTTSQKIVLWTMNGTQKIGNITPLPDQAVDFNWEIVAGLDYNGDGNRDFLWYNFSSGKIVLWTMDASVHRLTGMFTTPANAGDANWKVYAGGDYGVGPGGVSCTNDIVWRNATSGKNVVWWMDLTGNRTFGTFTIPDAPTVDPDSNATPATDWVLVGPK